MDVALAAVKRWPARESLKKTEPAAASKRSINSGELSKAVDSEKQLHAASSTTHESTNRKGLADHSQRPASPNAPGSSGRQNSFEVPQRGDMAFSKDWSDLNSRRRGRYSVPQAGGNMGGAAVLVAVSSQVAEACR